MVAFSKIAQLYDAVYADKDYKKEVNDLRGFIKPGMRVLDIGCGTGKHSVHLIKTNKVLGIDQSYEMAEIARSKGIDVIVTSIQTAPTDLPKSDVAIAMFDVLDYIIEYRTYDKALRTISKLLKVGGFFYYEGWNKDEINAAFDSVRSKKFKYDGAMWQRNSYTTYHKGTYSVRFVYSGDDKKINVMPFEETHKMHPRLGSRSNDLSKYGFNLVDIESDPYSVKAWFVKARNV